MSLQGGGEVVLAIAGELELKMYSTQAQTAIGRCCQGQPTGYCECQPVAHSL
ncbi:MAG: hypothetical protein KME26_23955 [Oscillatoria princeps RMCB-10]|nr:hypothetical protein [Oscillatoria princeps RMCB-10]